jgi:hypothetical protein
MARLETNLGKPGPAGREGRASVPEPQLHSHITDALPPGHPLAGRRVYCDHCQVLLHLQDDKCVRTWVESGRGNFCLRCFISVAGGLADHSTRVSGADRLARDFALEPTRAFRDEEASRWSVVRSRRRAALRRHAWRR